MGAIRGKNHNLSNMKTYKIWKDLRQRCNNPKDTAYKNYGGRGIAVCERWDDFKNFFADMGGVPEGSFIDRRDNNKGYDPENCRWVSRVVQNRNQKVRKDSTTGIPGVSLNKKRGKYQAYIWVHEKKHHLGYFDTIEKAEGARKIGELKYWGVSPDRDKRILKKVNVAGKVFSVDYPHHFTERSDIYGRVIFDESLIYISELAETGNIASRDHVWAIYWHELVHAINREFCSDQIGEETSMETLVNSIGKGIAQVLNDNYYLIPKRVK
jgi:hypothetical protein